MFSNTNSPDAPERGGAKTVSEGGGAKTGLCHRLNWFLCFACHSFKTLTLKV